MTTRIENSLRILRELNEARLSKKDKLLIRNLEAILQQHDYDARDKIDPRQMSIFEVKK